MNHDPLCPTEQCCAKDERATREFCQCDLIARVREDERGKEPCRCKFWSGYAAALSDAANFVRKTFNEHPLEFPTDYASLLAAEIESLSDIRKDAELWLSIYALPEDGDEQ